MKLVNFDLERPFASISIKGLGYEWNLHNCADFLGFDFDAKDNSISLAWNASSPEGTTWDGFPNNESKGCKLIFRNVTFLQLSPRDEASPRSDDWCVSGISKAIPKTSEYRFKAEWNEGEEFNLLFEFQSERTLEIGAESAELHVVS